MRTVAIIQARIGSTRLRAKVLRKVAGVPILRRVVEAVRCELVDDVLVATSTAQRDAVIVEQCSEWGVPVFCGPEEDVLLRFCMAAAISKADIIVRVCGDCPLLDTARIEPLVLAVRDGADYAAYRLENGKPAVLEPIGITCEAFTRWTLDYEHEQLDAHHEHVTAGMYMRPRPFAVRWLPLAGRPPLAAVDTVSDLRRVRRLYKEMLAGDETD